MNKNLIIKTDTLGSYIVCPYCDKTVMNYNLSQYPVNRYGAEIKYCCNCGCKLNWKNLRKKNEKKYK